MEAIKKKIGGFAEFLIVILLAFMCITMLHLHEKEQGEISSHQIVEQDRHQYDSGKFWENISDY